jgi:predicted DNA-binding transcriptional regulator AlpA
MQDTLSHPLRLVSAVEARLMCGGLSASMLRRLVARNEFPRPVVIARDQEGRPVRFAFVFEELQRWCEQRAAKDRGAT